MLMSSSNYMLHYANKRKIKIGGGRPFEGIQPGARNPQWNPNEKWINSYVADSPHLSVSVVSTVSFFGSAGGAGGKRRCFCLALSLFSSCRISSNERLI